MTRVDWRGRTAVITGASSGIGAATALRLAEAGLKVVLVARRLERLEALAGVIAEQGGQAEIETADLTRAEDRQRVFERHADADVLINNAGLCWYGYFSQIPEEEAARLLQLNVEATVWMTWEYLPGMVDRGFGRIINMGSVVGGFPMQGTAMYAGGKAFMDAFTTALQRELRGSGVQASVVRPGPVKTDFFNLTSTRPGGMPLPGEGFAVPADLVAKTVWGLLRRPRRVVYVPGVLRVMPWIEITCGWLIDLLGPVLLKRRSASVRPLSANRSS